MIHICVFFAMHTMYVNFDDVSFWLVQVADVQKLVAIFTNGSLDVSLRVAAARQICDLFHDQGSVAAARRFVCICVVQATFASTSDEWIVRQ